MILNVSSQLQEDAVNDLLVALEVFEMCGRKSKLDMGVSKGLTFLIRDWAHTPADGMVRAQDWPDV